MTAMPLPAAQQALLEQGFALHNQGRLVEAREVYRRLEVHNADSARLLGTVEIQLGHLEDGLGWLGRSIELIPEQPDIHHLMGEALQALGRLDRAVASYDLALRYNFRHAPAYARRGDTLLSLGRIAAAADSYAKALLVDAKLPWVPGAALYARLAMADWRDFAAQRDRVLAAVADTGTAASPSVLLTAADRPDLHRRAAEGFMAEKFPARPVLPSPTVRAQPERLRIGYFSTDFRNHPLAHLLAGLFERHDRARVEVFAFSFSGKPEDAWTRRIRAGVDHWIDLAGASAEAAAQAARDLGIDIAVDLTGLTDGCRADVFAARAAPVQASYLGYLGTMGTDYYDYLIADAVIVPPDKRAYYREAIACLPSFQINDDTQMPSRRVFTRADLGLPEDGFVFASFNRVYKILPEVFDGWMRILTQVPGSVLWLYCGDRTAADNLRREAEQRAVDPARLVFADLVQPDDHLARLSHAELILDTFPYNSGATASGALRMQVPVLTRSGEAFASRMAASLLTAVGLTELITDTPETYEELAVALSTDPARMAVVRAKLAANLPGSILFNTGRAARALEALFEAMHQRARDGLPPAAIEV